MKSVIAAVSFSCILLIYDLNIHAKEITLQEAAEACGAFLPIDEKRRIVGELEQMFPDGRTFRRRGDQFEEYRKRKLQEGRLPGATVEAYVSCLGRLLGFSSRKQSDTFPKGSYDIDYHSERYGRMTGTIVIDQLRRGSSAGYLKHFGRNPCHIDLTFQGQLDGKYLFKGGGGLTRECGSHKFYEVQMFSRSESYFAEVKYWPCCTDYYKSFRWTSGPIKLQIVVN